MDLRIADENVPRCSDVSLRAARIDVRFDLKRGHRPLALGVVNVVDDVGVVDLLLYIFKNEANIVVYTLKEPNIVLYPMKFCNGWEKSQNAVGISETVPTTWVLLKQIYSSFEITRR